LLILLSNDDGVDSEGILALREALASTDEVWVVAPEAERTCIGHAITLHKPLRIRDLGNRVFSTNGTPADSVLLALRVVLPRKPDLVISGINKGPNMGQDVSYSGTVAAAKEGAFAGITSLAVSLNGRSDFLFGHASRAVLDIVSRVGNSPLPPSTLLNVNIPNVPYGDIRGFVVTTLGKRIYNGNIIERKDPRGGTYTGSAETAKNSRPSKGPTSMPWIEAICQSPRSTWTLPVTPPWTSSRLYFQEERHENHTLHP